MTPKEVATILGSALRRYIWMGNRDKVNAVRGLVEYFADAFAYGDNPIPDFDREAFIKECEPETDTEN